MHWRRIKKSVVYLLACRRIRSTLIGFIIFICIVSLILTRDTSMDNWPSRTREQLYALRNILDNNNILSLKTTTSTPLFNTTTVSPEDRDKEIRLLFDMRSEPIAYKPKKSHPQLHKLLINNEDACKEKSVDLLIFFNSAWNNFQKRRLLRETWASKRTFRNLTIRTIFFLGKPEKDDNQMKIRSEAASYGDIVQGDFTDSFRNLSLKALTCLKWINDNCLHAKYIIKADDDIFVNVFKVVEDILPMLSTRKTTVACHFKKSGSSLIIRDPKSKWFVPKDIFPGQKYFPDFCTGYVAVFTTDVIPKMYEASYRAPFIFIDDVYIFGLLPRFFKTLYYIDIRQNCTLNNKIALYQYKSSVSKITYIVANAWDEGNMHDYWLAALSKLSPWAYRQARISKLRENKGPVTL